jgi:ABC-type multidrug transport system ATPase subunit
VPQSTSVVRSLRDTGVTVILTTHYIDDAEEMADRVGVLNKGACRAGYWIAGIQRTEQCN